MFKNIAILRPPTWSLQPLWRYLPAARLLDLLTSEELYFTNLPRLPDGLEGTLTARTRDQILHWSFKRYSNWDLARQELAVYEKNSAAFFVNCWHMNRCESYLMWKAYGDRGCAIQSTFERVQAAFDRFPGEVYGGCIDYIDFSREAPPAGNIFSHVIKKDLPYEDEREFRLIYWQPQFGDEFADPAPEGVRVKVDLRLLIESIYPSPRLGTLPPDILEAVRSQKLDCDIRTSTLKDLSEGKP